MDLVAFFSATGVTKKYAMSLASHLKADYFEIMPVKSYSKLDLNWMNPLSRSSIEMRKKDSRPEFIKKELDISKYNKIYLGFPIWWYMAPHIVNSFLEAYDFKGKTIVLFATSGSSGFGKTIDSIKKSTPDSKVIEGRVNPKDFSWVK